MAGRTPHSAVTRRGMPTKPIALAALGVILLGALLAYAVGASNSPGSAPDFRLPAMDGGTISLSEFRGKKNVLLYFNMGTG